MQPAFYTCPITKQLIRRPPQPLPCSQRRHFTTEDRKMLAQLAVHYSRLGINPSATRAELTAAYRAAALKHHPDRGGSASAFAQIKESYEVLERYGGPHTYRPASLRYADQRNGDWDGIWGILGSIVLPTAVGLGVGIRLMYVGGERSGLRAGGTSRVAPPNAGAFTPGHTANPPPEASKPQRTESS